MTDPPAAACAAGQVVREAYGKHLPDRRRSRSELRALVGSQVDLSAIADEHDTL